ncbi:type II toxin-antitoxin system RelE/ParE family toxin [Algoriphagus formosus]|uniref:type II toxin-antitoxin system RelE/ParE family toxin n=1 Tax=Algoriphagus formosus TaxID=2007308 RepID=UPI000C28DA1C|nr:type II toxin-antitoxin system RelE/ParE family toxin [Algoriphagus formosus]
MYFVEKTSEFDSWIRKLKDRVAKAKILLRLQRIEEHGNFGDSQSVGNGILELRIHYGKGYRVYFKQKGNHLILLLVGGDKSTQAKDIEKALALWKI